MAPSVPFKGRLYAARAQRRRQSSSGLGGEFTGSFESYFTVMADGRLIADRAQKGTQQQLYRIDPQKDRDQAVPLPGQRPGTYARSKLQACTTQQPGSSKYSTLTKPIQVYAGLR